MPFIQIKDKSICFRLRRSQRAKRLQIIVRAQHFEVVAPPRIRNQEILRFLWQHQRWMMRQFQRKNQIIAPLEFSWPENFTAGQTLPFRGRRLMLNIKFGVRASTQLQENVLLITLPWISIKCEDIEINIKKQILLWYQQQTHDFIAQSIEIFCPQLGRWPAGFGLKQQKTRWGSCGIQQKIYINWLLVLAPIGVLEYVVAHELCHLFHRNHGKRFWAKVANCYAEYETHEKWLTKHGHLLMPAQRM